MKKATAFVSLFGSLLILFGILYLVQYPPAEFDLQPLAKVLKDMVKPKFQQPAIAIVTLLWVVNFLLSLIVLLEPSADSEKKVLSDREHELKLKNEQIEKLAKELEKTKSDAKKDEDYDKSKNIEQLEKLQQQLSKKEEEIEKLKLEIADSNEKEEMKDARASQETSSDDSIEMEALQTKIEENDKEIESLKRTLKEKEEASGDQEEEKKKVKAEIDSLYARIKKAEQDVDLHKKEAKSVKKELQKALEDFECSSEALKSKSDEVEILKKELQDIKANEKGGKEGIPPAAYQILFLLQKEGRLIDLLMEDIEDFDDETLGGAIRPIHEGCRKLLEERLIIEHVLDEEEGDEVTLDEVDPEAIKLSGNVPGEGPYTGELIHRGWRLKECNLPELVDGWSGNVIAPAEIEIS